MSKGISMKGEMHKGKSYKNVGIDHTEEKVDFLSMPGAKPAPRGDKNKKVKSGKMGKKSAAKK